MEWEGREESSNVEDRRGLGRKVGIAAGGVGTLIVIIVALVRGVDPQQLLGPGGLGQQGQQGGQAAGPPDPQEERLAKFSKVIFHDTEVVWGEQFRRMGREYRKPTLVL